MSLVPTVTPTTAKFRGPSSSADYNAFQRSATNDIVTAFTALQAAQSATTLTNEVLTQTYTSLGSTVSQLEGLVGALQQSFATLKVLGSSTTGSIASAGSVTLVQSLYNAPVNYGGFPSFYPASAPLSAQGRAGYAPQYGQITPNLASAPLSKAYVFDALDGSLVLPPGVIAATEPVVSPTIAPFLIEENDLVNAVDGDATTFWRRNVYFAGSSYISDVTTTVTLTLPEQFVNNLTCNYVTIHPYPEFGCDITSVVLHGAPGSSDTQLLPLDSQGNIQPIAGAGKTRLLFTDRSVISIDVTLRCATPNYTLKPGLQCFTVGASVLDFGYIGFTQAPAQILIPFTLNNNFFEYVTSVSPAVPGVSYQLYYADATGDIVDVNLGATLPAYTRTIYVGCTLDPTTGLFPVLSQLQLQFYPVYLTS